MTQKIKYAYSTAGTAAQAAAELKGALAGMEPALVLFFASSRYEPAAMAQSMAQAFGPAQTIGCTTAGEIVSGHVLTNSVAAMAFSRQAAGDFSIAVVRGLKEGPDAAPAFEAFKTHFKADPHDMQIDKYVGLILVDGLSGAEEELMDQIGDQTNVFFVGGSAGDDLAFAQTHVFANGQALTDAAVLALFKPGLRFSFIKTQSFSALATELTATRVDEASRTVHEFNGLPARQAYAQAVGAEPEEADKRFMEHPVGLMVGDEPYVRSPQQFKGDSMVFYCNVLEGMSLSLLKSLDIVADTARALAEHQAENGPIAALVNFHCILRTLELIDKGQTQAYGQVFKDIPTIGFSTYGEEFLGHVNQTSTMLAFHE